MLSMAGIPLNYTCRHNRVHLSRPVFVPVLKTFAFVDVHEQMLHLFNIPIFPCAVERNLPSGRADDRRVLLVKKGGTVKPNASCAGRPDGVMPTKLAAVSGILAGSCPFSVWRRWEDVGEERMVKFPEKKKPHRSGGLVQGRSILRSSGMWPDSGMFSPFP